jgi:large subunit ribosomal protein L24
MKIRKGDTIKVLYGKDAGKRAQIIAVDTKKKMVVADGVNVYKRHIKGDGRNRNSEIVNIVKPMPVSKVMLICPLCNKATRVEMKIENGKKVRFCKKCGKVMDGIKEEKKEEKKEIKKTDDKKKKVETKDKKTKSESKK